MTDKRCKVDRLTLEYLIEQGLTNKQIADKLNVSDWTVRNAVQRWKLKRPKALNRNQKLDEPGEPIKYICDEGAENLAVAIIERAAQDYRLCLNHPKKEIKYSGIQPDTINTFRTFFRSDYAELLFIITKTQIDPEKIIDFIESDTDTKYKRPYFHSRDYWDKWKASKNGKNR